MRWNISAVVKDGSLLASPVLSIVNPEMASTVRFYDGNVIYGPSGPRNWLMLILAG